jgi:hypothetical protein
MPVTRPHGRLLGSSYGITTYLNPPFRSAESDNPAFSNQVIERITIDDSDFIIYQYYRYSHSIVPPVPGIQFMFADGMAYKTSVFTTEALF